MINVGDGSTIGETFLRAASTYSDKSFLAVPPNPGRAYSPKGREISYSEAAKAVGELATVYKAAGYGVGHRVSLLLENRPDHILHKLAMNTLGVCCVPLNPHSAFQPGVGESDRARGGESEGGECHGKDHPPAGQKKLWRTFHRHQQPAS